MQDDKLNKNDNLVSYQYGFGTANPIYKSNFVTCVCLSVCVCTSRQMDTREKGNNQKKISSYHTIHTVPYSSVHYAYGFWRFRTDMYCSSWDIVVSRFSWRIHIYFFFFTVPYIETFVFEISTDHSIFVDWFRYLLTYVHISIFLRYGTSLLNRPPISCTFTGIWYMTYFCQKCIFFIFPPESILIHFVRFYSVSVPKMVER